MQGLWLSHVSDTAEHAVCSLEPRLVFLRVVIFHLFP